jgi:hypothetical protein
MIGWLKSVDWIRVGRTALQVFGPVLILFLYDFGKDGVVNVRDYVFGDNGFIVIGTTALAVWMNRPK